MLYGDPAPPKKGHSLLPNFQPMSIVANRLDGSRRHLVWGRPQLSISWSVYITIITAKASKPLYFLK